MVGNWFIYGTLHAFIPGMLLKGRKSDLRGKDTHVISFPSVCVCVLEYLFEQNEEFVLTAEKIWVTVFNLW